MTRAVKILPPAVPTSSIARPALEERLGEALARRLTTVTAAAGYGKSTLLARWGATTGCAWYTVDRGDDSLASLVPGLVEALRVRVPGLPADLSADTAWTGADDRGRAEAFAAHLSEALQEQLGDSLPLILDDVQELDPDAPAARLIEALCRNAPDRLHLVLASRSEPPFPIERLRGRGQVLALDPPSLAFSPDEVAELLRATLDHDADAIASRLHATTGGWPAAVRLALEALRATGGEASGRVLEGLARPGGPLFSYLAEEVFAREPAGVRDFLRRMAPFDRFTVELCEALGMRSAERILTSLIRRGLFVQRRSGSEEWFALHGLIREFAVETWPLSTRELRSLHRRAAGWFEAHGQVEPALLSLAAASDARAVARLLSERGLEILAGGSVESVLRLVEQLPARLRDARIEEVLGEAHTIRGEAGKALECFRRAAGEGEELRADLAWRMGLMHHERGEHEEALRVYARGKVDADHTREEALLLAATASARLLRGDLEGSRALTPRALAAAKRSRDPQALAVAHGALMLEKSGRDPRGSEAHYRAGLEAAGQAGDVLLTIRLRTNRASHLDEEGAYQEALEELDLAIRQAELAGYAERLALALNNRGVTRFHLGHLEEAIADLEQSRAIYQRSGSTRAAWPNMNLGMVFRERGDLALARAVLEEALALAEKSDDVQGLVGSRTELARILVSDEPDRAWSTAEAAVAAARGWGGLVNALVAAGWVALARGELTRAAELAAEARHEATTRRNRPGLAEALELQALSGEEGRRASARLEEAIAIWRELGNPLGEARAEMALARLKPGPASRAAEAAALRRLQALGVRPHAAAGAAGILEALPKDEPPAVEIRTLGGFRVLREGQPVPASDWQSKKARDLVKILLSRRWRPTPREVVMEALWPSEDAARLANRLSVALATARAVLDPQRRFPSEHFIAGDDAALWLERSHLPVDVETFLEESAIGLALQRQARPVESHEALAAAEARYTGDFLEEDPYEDWAAALREEARATYISVTHALARHASAQGDADAAVRYRLRILERDPYDEEAHLGLVSTLSAAGRHGEARRSYGTYAARMEDLGVEPAPFATSP